MTEIQFDRNGALTALSQLVVGCCDGTISNERAAELLDDLVDTGPWDSADDPVFVGLVDAIEALVPDGVSLWHVFDRDPVAMRGRADRLTDDPERAARIRARADRVEARRS